MVTGALALSGKVEGVGDVTVKLEGVRDDASLFVFPDTNKGEVQDAEVGQLAVAVAFCEPWFEVRVSA